MENRKHYKLILNTPEEESTYEFYNSKITDVAETCAKLLGMYIDYTNVIDIHIEEVKERKN